MTMTTAPTFTVFTPTYQRAHTLARLRASLARQTLRDLEWLVVDDGSTDGTGELFGGWREDPGFPVRYLRQENAGKHVAFNRGVREARGALFLNVDADDELVPEALERFLLHWHSIPAERRTGFSAVTARCVDGGGSPVGDPLPEDVLDSDSLEMYFRHRVRGEKCGFHRTEVLRAHPFPEPPGVKFVSEGVVWFAIARRWKTRYVNECLRVYHSDASPDGGLSRLSRSTAAGRRLFHEALLNEYADWLAASPRVGLRTAANFARYAFAGGLGVPAQLGAIRPAASRAAVLGLMPLGFGLYLRDRLAGLR